MIYELRLYSVTPGRMPDVHARFTQHLPALFARHGVNCVGRWSALAGPDAPRFVYLMAYRDYAQREATWAGFYQDAEWWRVRAQTNAGHEMVERHDLFFLKPNPAWQVDRQAAGSSVSGLHELVLQELAPGQTAATVEFLKDTWLPLLREVGARTLGVFDMAAGVGMAKTVLLNAWPDAQAWHAGQKLLAAHEGLRSKITEQRKSLGTALFQRAEVNLLEPAPGAVIRGDLGLLQD